MALLAAGPSSACSCFCDDICSLLGDCCPWCRAGDIPTRVRVEPLVDQEVLITVTGPLTTKMSGGGCSIGLDKSVGFQEVHGAQLINVASGDVIYDFESSEGAGSSLEKLTSQAGLDQVQGTDWSGFYAPANSEVPDGIATQFSIRATRKDSVPLRMLLWNIQHGGLLAGGSAEADGSFDFHHYFVRGLGEMDLDATPNK